MLKPIAKGLKVDSTRHVHGSGTTAICAFRPKTGLDVRRWCSAIDTELAQEVPLAIAGAKAGLGR
jgi:hypothetical protein